MTETVFSEKLKDTPIGRMTRLYMLALAELRKRNNNPLAAQRGIADAVQNDLNAIKELCGDELRVLIETKAYQYARRVAADQSGKVDDAGRIHVAQKGQERDASASFHQPLSIPENGITDRDGMGHGPVANNGHEDCAHPVSDTKSKNDGERGRAVDARNGRLDVAPSPSPEITGRGLRTHASDGHSAIAPSRDRFVPGHARRGAASIAAVQPVMAKSLLDTWTVRDGRTVGDLMLKELPGLVGANRKEAAILDKIRNHSANGGPSQLVREIISVESLERFISEAEEATRAA